MENDKNFNGLKAIFVNCTLKRSPRQSHTNGLMQKAVSIMKAEGVSVDEIRLVDHQVASGIQPDMYEVDETKDEWPQLAERILAADILVIGTPIWLGEKSSQAQLLIERLYSLSGQMNEKGQYIYYGKTGGCMVTGNEDGVKHCAMGILYALQHLGYSVPPQADCGWIGEVGPGPSYLDKESGAESNDFTNRNLTFMTYNLLHTARMLKAQGGFPVYGNSAKDWEQGERWAFENEEAH